MKILYNNTMYDYLLLIIRNKFRHTIVLKKVLK